MQLIFIELKGEEYLFLSCLATCFFFIMLFKVILLLVCVAKYIYNIYVCLISPFIYVFYLLPLFARYTNVFNVWFFLYLLLLFFTSLYSLYPSRKVLNLLLIRKSGIITLCRLSVRLFKNLDLSDYNS